MLFGSLQGVRFGAGPLSLIHEQPWSEKSVVEKAD